MSASDSQFSSVGSADHDRHELFARLDALQERQLHLDGVFSLVRAALERDAAVGLHQRARQLAVNRHVAQRRGIRAFRPDGKPARHRVGVIRAQHDDGIVIHALGLLERVRRDVAGKDVPGVRADQAPPGQART